MSDLINGLIELADGKKQSTEEKDIWHVSYQPDWKHCQYKRSYNLHDKLY